jgi:hypothetical protein
MVSAILKKYSTYFLFFQFTLLPTKIFPTKPSVVTISNKHSCLENIPF